MSDFWAGLAVAACLVAIWASGIVSGRGLPVSDFWAGLVGSACLVAIWALGIVFVWQVWVIPFEARVQKELAERKEREQKELAERKEREQSDA